VIYNLTAVCKTIGRPSKNTRIGGFRNFEIRLCIERSQLLEKIEFLNNYLRHCSDNGSMNRQNNKEFMITNVEISKNTGDAASSTFMLV